MSKTNEDTHGFKAGDKYYELFISPNDEHFELYEKDNPKEGLIFDSKKQIISFVNFLTDLIEEEVS